jgi:hypothetical protein
MLSKSKKKVAQRTVEQNRDHRLIKVGTDGKALEGVGCCRRGGWLRCAGLDCRWSRRRKSGRNRGRRGCDRKVLMRKLSLSVLILHEQLLNGFGPRRLRWLRLLQHWRRRCNVRWDASRSCRLTEVRRRLAHRFFCFASGLLQDRSIRLAALTKGCSYSLPVSFPCSGTAWLASSSHSQQRVDDE